MSGVAPVTMCKGSWRLPAAGSGAQAVTVAPLARASSSAACSRCNWRSLTTLVKCGLPSVWPPYMASKLVLTAATNSSTLSRGTSA